MHSHTTRAQSRPHQMNSINQGGPSHASLISGGPQNLPSQQQTQKMYIPPNMRGSNSHKMSQGAVAGSQQYVHPQRNREQQNR